MVTPLAPSDARPAPDFTIRPQGPFSLEESASFGFGQRAAATYEGVMRLAFCVDGYDQQVGVALASRTTPTRGAGGAVAAARTWAAVLIRAAGARRHAACEV